jgi:hypothetical protein
VKLKGTVVVALASLFLYRMELLLWLLSFLAKGTYSSCECPHTGALPLVFEDGTDRAKPYQTERAALSDCGKVLVKGKPLWMRFLTNL